MSRRSLPIALGTVIALTGLSVGIAVASIPASDGTINACYAKRNGAVRVINAPAASCAKDELPISWNQAGVPGERGEPGTGVGDLSDIPCTTELGPGVVVADVVAPTNLRGGLHFPTTLSCKPANVAGIQIEMYGFPRLTATAAVITGPELCIEGGGDPSVCIWYVPFGTEVTMSATPFTGWEMTLANLWEGLDPSCLGQPTCTFTATEEVYIGQAWSNPIE